MNFYTERQHALTARNSSILNWKGTGGGREGSVGGEEGGRREVGKFGRNVTVVAGAVAHLVRQSCDSLSKRSNYTEAICTKAWGKLPTALLSSSGHTTNGLVYRVSYLWA